MALNFLKLTPDLIAPLTHLKVREDETHLLSANAPWMAQATLDPNAITFGVFSHDTPVGLISLVDPRVSKGDDEPLTPDCIYVWRVMVDHAHRGIGIGRRCMEFAQTYAALIGLSGVSLTTADTLAGNALPFYQHLGFTPTDRRLHGEIELIRRSPDAPLPLAFLPPTFDTIADMSALETASHKSHLVLPASRTIAQGLVSAENTTYCAYRNGTLVGILSLDDPRVMHEDDPHPAGNCIDVWQLMVGGPHEGTGIGTALVDFAKSYARLVGLNGVTLVTMDHANHNAKPFYEKLGFAATGRRHSGDLEMIWHP